MAPSKPVTAAEVRAALRPVLAWLNAPDAVDTAPAPPAPSDTAADLRTPRVAQATPDRTTLATAVRLTLRAFAQAHPGKAVEVRVPPFAAVQCLPGGAHTRGTPPHVVEVEPRSWLRLVTGRTTWDTERGSTRLHASGHRADDVGARLPLQAATESD